MPELPGPVVLAVELVRSGADVVVVGGTAQLLRSGRHQPRDLDVVVPPDAVGRLIAVLGQLGVRVRTSALLDGRVVRLATGWGPLDVFVDDRPACTAVPVAGTEVPVAAA